MMAGCRRNQRDVNVLEHAECFALYVKKSFRTWREEGGEIVEDLRVSLPPCEADHRADIQREGPQLLPGTQAVHFQHILHIVEETHKQVAGVGTGGKYCRRNTAETFVHARQEMHRGFDPSGRAAAHR